jgi:predicted metal-dependent enzyme (double-stranded beta helix superfamily)
MQDCTARLHPSGLPVKWCHWGIVCLLLFAFNNTAFAQPCTDVDTNATQKQTSTVTLLTNSPSAMLDVSLDDTDVDDAIHTTVQIRVHGLAFAPSIAVEQTPPSIQWRWHPVRGPPSLL